MVCSISKFFPKCFFLFVHLTNQFKRHHVAREPIVYVLGLALRVQFYAHIYELIHN